MRGSLCEWVRHHHEQGVSHFYLIDNNSSDDWQQTLRGLRAYPSQARCYTYSVRPGNIERCSLWQVTVVRDLRRNEQPTLYNEVRRCGLALSQP